MDIRTQRLNAPGIPELSISVPPKVGCRSVREWLWELGTGSKWTGGHSLWDMFYSPELCRQVEVESSERELRIAIHRGGVDRMRAVYDHLILEKDEWIECTLEEFAWNLSVASIESPHMCHHCLPQWHWLGGDPRFFDIILPISEIHRLPQIAARHLQRKVPALPHRHKTREKSRVSKEAEQLFAAWTAYDTLIGWDGKTILLPDEWK